MLMKNELRVNLGSGGLPLEGYINVDMNPDSPNVDIVHNLDIYPWPFEDDSVDEVSMVHCLEHLDDHNRGMKEIYRILKKGAKAKLIVPHFTWQYAYADPTHKHFFAYWTFFYYTKKGGYFDFAFSSCKVKIVFGKTLSFWNWLLEPLFNLMPNIYEQSVLRMFPAIHISAELVK